MAEQVIYTTLNLQDPESTRVTGNNKPAGRREFSTRAQREEPFETLQGVRQDSVSCPWKYKCLIIGLSVTSLILLISSVSLGIMMNNTEDLRQDLDLCSSQIRSLNLSLSQSQNSEQNLTHRPTTQILQCLKQHIKDTDKCPPGWTLINGKCYFFSDETKTRGESDSFCHKKKAQLATVKPCDTTLQQSVKSRYSEYWIGLTRRTEGRNRSPAWYWNDGTIEMSLAEAGLCATMAARLRVTDCEEQRRWICEKATERFDLTDTIKECIIGMSQ